ncbi:ribonuclease P protein subunit p20-like [Artemia franciscana]|uniref:Ribonuclease P protein subunit p20 n=1 Tax=Artemia franciscana TaxID=6661 RepID=A0AA88L4V0_ARTSF|nr:hypothetical protein QYM36_015638 [Artemia franciscana]KAK2708015.1 hypothetical protein QYM36_015638 [Artemia franciscana]
MAEPEVQAAKKPRIVFDPEEFSLRKRLPPKLPKRNNDIYVNNKTDFKAQLARCRKLLEDKETTIYIHGLGAALPRAINLALTLKDEFHGILEVSPTTSTVELLDDLEPLQDHLEPMTQPRKSSAVHIKLTKVVPQLPSTSDTI